MSGGVRSAWVACQAYPRQVFGRGRRLRSAVLGVAAVLAVSGCVGAGGAATPGNSTLTSPAPAITTPVLATPAWATPEPAPTSGDTVDGFKLGVIVVCSPPVDVDAATLDRGCVGFPKRAMAALDTREPSHAAVVRTGTYSDGTQPEPVDYSRNVPSPTPAPTAHPGPLVMVFVFTLADGSIRATGVACTGNGPTSSCIGVGSYPN